VKGLNPEQAHLVTMFKSSATSATGLKQTYTEAMSKMAGGATGLNVALMLSGKHMGDLVKNTKAIAARAKDASGNVQGWSAIQGTFNFKLSQAKTGVENTGIAIGTALLPAVTAILSGITKIVIPIAEWTAKHKTLTEILFVGVTAIAATVAILVVARKAFDAVKGAVDTVKATLRALGIMSKETADTQVKSAETAASAQESSSAEASAAMEGDAAEVAAANEEAAEESADKYAWMAAKQETAAEEGAAASETAAEETAAANEAGAAESSASWLASAAAGVAGAVMWVAESVGKVAAVVASNVAGAAVTMAAWIAANAAMLLGIGLIVVAVVAAVILIVKYWKDIEKAAVDVWHAIVAGAKAAWSGITGFVRDIWRDITGAITAANDAIKRVISAAWAFIKAAVTREVDGVKAILSWFGRLAGLFRGWWDDATGAVRSAQDKMIGFVREIPGRIMSALGDVDSLLFSSGKKIIQGLINGVSSMIGAVGNTISSVVSTIKSYLPFSPAKQGPLAGAGDPANSGRSIVRNLAKGMLAGRGDITSAAAQVAGAALFRPGAGLTTSSAGLGLSALGSGGGGGAGGGITIINDVHGNYVMSDSDINKLVGKLGPAVTQALGQAGVKIRMQ